MYSIIDFHNTVELVFVVVNHCGLSIFNGSWGCNFTDSLVRTAYNKLGLFHNSLGMLSHG